MTTGTWSSIPPASTGPGVGSTTRGDAAVEATAFHDGDAAGTLAFDKMMVGPRVFDLAK